MSIVQSVTLTHAADAGQRVDRFIKKYLPNAALGGIYKMLRTGKIKVNGKKKDHTYKLELGDEITFWLSGEEIDTLRNTQNDTKNLDPTISLSQTMPPLQILYEDAFLMVVNKPAGLNVHAGDHKTTESNLIDLVQDHLAGRYDSLTFRPALVHRIDRDTSGCIIIAKDKQVLEVLLESLQSHQIEKIYHAFVIGKPESLTGTIRAKLLRIENADHQAKVRVDASGQSATTHYRILRSGSLHGAIQSEQTYSLLECCIETGRTHQIRVHMNYIGHPIIADTAYGDKRLNAYLCRQLGIDRQLLHARQLSFTHPKTGQCLVIEAPYPSDFQKMLDTIT